MEAKAEREKRDHERSIADMRTIHDAELNKLNAQHQKIIEQFNKDAESASAKIKEEMTE